MQLEQREKYFLIVCQSVNRVDRVDETDDSSDCESTDSSFTVKAMHEKQWFTKVHM